MADTKVSHKTTSFISEGLELTGNLKLEGGIRIDGSFHGNIESASSIFLGEHALVQAKIVTHSISSAGQIQGDIVAEDTVKINHPGSLKGTVTTKHLVLEKDVFFEGRCQLLNDVELVKPKLKKPTLPRIPIPKRKK